MDMSDQLHAPASLLPEERSSDFHWVGGWVGHITDLDVVVAKRKMSAQPGIEIRSSST
jgi:hypothetical protein